MKLLRQNVSNAGTRIAGAIVSRVRKGVRWVKEDPESAWKWLCWVCLASFVVTVALIALGIVGALVLVDSEGAWRVDSTRIQGIAYWLVTYLDVLLAALLVVSVSIFAMTFFLILLTGFAPIVLIVAIIIRHRYVFLCACLAIAGWAVPSLMTPILFEHYSQAKQSLAWGAQWTSGFVYILLGVLMWGLCGFVSVGAVMALTNPRSLRGKWDIAQTEKGLREIAECMRQSKVTGGESK